MKDSVSLLINQVVLPRLAAEVEESAVQPAPIAPPQRTVLKRKMASRRNGEYCSAEYLLARRTSSIYISKYTLYILSYRWDMQV